VDVAIGQTIDLEGIRQLASVHRVLRLQSDSVDSIEGSRLREELDNNAIVEEVKWNAYEVVLCFVSHRPREDPSQSPNLICSPIWVQSLRRTTIATRAQELSCHSLIM
jgi:hypothetical protein